MDRQNCHTRHAFSKKEAAEPEACKICHMGFGHAQCAPEGDHRVFSAWGFLAVRLPEADEEWMGYRTTILKGLGVLDPQGKPSPRLESDYTTWYG